MGLVTISSKGQMTLPKQIRDELQIQPGDQCYVWVRGGDIVVMPKNKNFNDLAGLLESRPKALDHLWRKSIRPLKKLWAVMCLG
jgi:AbrB family looped-hinge helix DNA binding protein